MAPRNATESPAPCGAGRPRDFRGKVSGLGAYWRDRRKADVRVRLEYRQEKLHAFVQAREVRYPDAHGHYKTEFAIIGDDFFDDGRVIAWRASLIVNGRIVAVTRSYLWE